MQILTTDNRHDAGSRESQSDSPQPTPSQEQMQRFADLLKKKRTSEALGVPSSLPSPLDTFGGTLKTVHSRSLAPATLRALAESIFMLAAIKIQNAGSSLHVTVHSGMLAGVEMRVAQLQGRLKMTLRAANPQQFEALKGMRHKLEQQMSSLYSLESILIERLYD
ncbi:hypothetical protein [Mycoavidus sp. B2-EB]|uniref:hypothetical protein n=1 Tax=Mycoavidus sp. B2-EB TaxID=2651972 RepID=UPI001624F537|nr:hypothetical protein [Mycoavidus sp. B2-EB]BBO59081.1 hypothetical protein MPB2EB_0182 [Mycoavidus sp. B2-EB]